jgi:hypothetical protein
MHKNATGLHAIAMQGEEHTRISNGAIDGVICIAYCAKGIVVSAIDITDGAIA